MKHIVSFVCGYNNALQCLNIAVYKQTNWSILIDAKAYLCYAWTGNIKDALPLSLRSQFHSKLH